ncbi:MAG TPA: hypothetical protein VK662_05445, partial [Acidothermaceae bacterium]|nr:hypothetical protein [Acidothermaceae bacterium]
MLVLTGLVLSAITMWFITYRSEPAWWINDWRVGYGQTVLSLTVMMAAQLATARSRRDGLQQLYESFPTSTGQRTLAHLLGVLGAVPATLILIGAAATTFAVQGALGAPDPAALTGGVLLVVAAGAIGVAIGTRFPHPLAGVLGAFLWLLPFSQSNRFNGAIPWLFPWVKPAQLGELPSRLAGYPPALAHAFELAAIVILASGVALAITAAATQHRVAALGVIAGALAATVAAGVVQLQPIPTRDVDRVISEAVNSPSVQHCSVTDTGGHRVSYCLYPEFGRLLGSLEGPVSSVLSQVPDQQATALTISQTGGLNVDDPTLTHGHSSQQVDAWRAELQGAPANLPSSSALFVDLGAWPASGQQRSVVRFDLALGAAEWAVGLPTNGGAQTGLQPTQCIPQSQAREAIAIWLAAHATYLPSAVFQGHNGSYSVEAVNGTAVVVWTYPGEISNYFPSPGAQTTADGYLLARAMTTLPTA